MLVALVNGRLMARETAGQTFADICDVEDGAADMAAIVADEAAADARAQASVVTATEVAESYAA